MAARAVYGVARQTRHVPREQGLRLHVREREGLTAMTRTLVALSLPSAFFILLYAIAAAQCAAFAARALLSVAR
jgi:hypothetical protein